MAEVEVCFARYRRRLYRRDIRLAGFAWYLEVIPFGLVQPCAGVKCIHQVRTLGIQKGMGGNEKLVLAVERMQSGGGAFFLNTSFTLIAG